MATPAFRPHGWAAALTVLAAAAAAAGAVLLFTHVVAPLVLTHYDHNPTLARMPTRTRNRAGREADPVNVAVVGTAEEVAAAFARAGWTRADSLSRKSDLAIARSVLLDRPDSTAPVSSLFLYGRRQDVAFEREVGRSARRRHHVRLWLATGATDHGRPIWIGDAAYDLRAGISHRSFAPTHHIEADVDRERDTVLADLAAAGQLVEQYAVTGMGPRVDARNAEGDRFDTDGELEVGVISPDNATHAAPTVLPDPLLVTWKNRVWAWGHNVARLVRPAS
jgi:LssY C-terminus